MAVETPPPQPDVIEFIRALWVQLISIVAIIVWLIRGEAKTTANANAIRALWKQREEDLRAHRDARESTNETLNEVKDDLREVRSDIKTLLQRK